MKICLQIAAALIVLFGPMASHAQESLESNVLLSAFVGTCGGMNGDRERAGDAAIAAGWTEVSVEQYFGAAAAAHFDHLYLKQGEDITLFLATGNLPGPEAGGSPFEVCNVTAYPSRTGGTVPDPRPALATWIQFAPNPESSTEGEPKYMFTMSAGRRTSLNMQAISEVEDQIVADGIHTVAVIHDPAKSALMYLVRRTN